MLTFEQALLDQQDLDRLCAHPQPLPVEHFQPNNYYGHAGVLKRYAGVPAEQPLRVMVQHGVTLGHGLVWEAELRAGLPVYCWERHREAVYRRHGCEVVPGAAPLLYAMRNLRYVPRPGRTGTLFFPAHSTEHITAYFDLERVLRMLPRLPQPVTVCLYWRDWQLGRGEIYRSAGLPVVSAGNMWDPDFLYRWLHLASAHRYAASNDIGSSALYAVAAGLPFVHLDGDEPAYSSDSAAQRALVGDDKACDQMAIAQALFADLRGEIIPSQAEFIDEHLGRRNLAGPERLREVIA